MQRNREQNNHVRHTKHSQTAGTTQPTAVQYVV